jgi:hypothetical protein
MRICLLLPWSQALRACLLVPWRPLSGACMLCKVLFLVPPSSGVCLLSSFCGWVLQGHARPYFVSRCDADRCAHWRALLSLYLILT